MVWIYVSNASYWNLGWKPSKLTDISYFIAFLQANTNTALSHSNHEMDMIAEPSWISPNTVQAIIEYAFK